MQQTSECSLCHQLVHYSDSNLFSSQFDIVLRPCCSKLIHRHCATAYWAFAENNTQSNAVKCPTCNRFCDKMSHQPIANDKAG